MNTLQEAAALIKPGQIRNVLDPDGIDHIFAKDVASAIWNDTEETTRKTIQRGLQGPGSTVIKKHFYVRLAKPALGWAALRMNSPEEVRFQSAKIIFVHVSPSNTRLFWDVMTPSTNPPAESQTPSEQFVAAIKRGLQDGKFTRMHIAQDAYAADRAISENPSKTAVTVLDVASVNDGFQREVAYAIWNHSDPTRAAIQRLLKANRTDSLNINLLINLSTPANGWHAENTAAVAVRRSFRKLTIDRITVSSTHEFKMVTIHWYPLDHDRQPSSSSSSRR